MARRGEPLFAAASPAKKRVLSCLKPPLTFQVLGVLRCREPGALPSQGNRGHGLKVRDPDKDYHDSFFERDSGPNNFSKVVEERHEAPAHSVAPFSCLQASEVREIVSAPESINGSSRSTCQKLLRACVPRQTRHTGKGQSARAGNSHKQEIEWWKSIQHSQEAQWCHSFNWQVDVLVIAQAWHHAHLKIGTSSKASSVHITSRTLIVSVHTCRRSPHPYPGRRRHHF